MGKQETTKEEEEDSPVHNVIIEEGRSSAAPVNSNVVIDEDMAAKHVEEDVLAFVAAVSCQLDAPTDNSGGGGGGGGGVGGGGAAAAAAAAADPSTTTHAAKSTIPVETDSSGSSINSSSTSASNENMNSDSIVQTKEARDDAREQIDGVPKPLRSLQISTAIRPGAVFRNTPGAFEVFPNNPSSLLRRQQQQEQSEEEDMEAVLQAAGDAHGTIASPSVDNTSEVPEISLSQDEDLIEAQAVDDIVEATAKPMEWWTPKKIFILVMLGLAIFAAIIAPITVVLTKNDQQEFEDEMTAQTLPPEERQQAIQQVLIEEAYAPLLNMNETIMSPVFQNASTPQYRAFQWLTEEDAHAVRSTDHRRLVQRYALAVLYFATGGETSWVESFEFLQGDHECSWSGALLCDHETQTNITGITLQRNGLMNHLPAELAFLTSLQLLDLGSNNLVGTLPPSIHQLTHLDLNRNDFSGSIPSSYSIMTDLSLLHLQMNQLEGTIFEDFGNLRQLTSLDFEANGLTGTIPDSMWDLTNMEVFILDTQKHLEGSIPTQIGLWKNASIFLVNVLNGLSGSTIPTEIGLLTGLIELKTAQNHMRGTVSAERCLWILVNCRSYYCISIIYFMTHKK